MRNGRFDLFSELVSAHDRHAVLAAALKAVRPFGVEHCGWRALRPSSSSPRYALLHATIISPNDSPPSLPCGISRTQPTMVTLNAPMRKAAVAHTVFWDCY